MILKKNSRLLYLCVSVAKIFYPIFKIKSSVINFANKILRNFIIIDRNM